MVNCWKCGAVLNEGEDFCSKCGLRIRGFDKPSDKADLIKKLDEYRLLLDEYEYIVATVQPQDNFPREEGQTAFKKRSFFRFFWPFLVIAAVILYVVGALTSLFGTASKDVVTLLLGTLLGVVMAVVVIVFGVKVAKRKQADVNGKAEEMDELAKDRYNRGVANQKKIDRLAVLEEKKDKLDPLVPVGFRDFDHVAKIEEMIMKNRADSIEEAIAKIKEEG